MDSRYRSLSPEKKTGPVIRADYARELLSAYEMFNETFRRIAGKESACSIFWKGNKELAETLYGEACSYFDGARRLKAGDGLIGKIREKAKKDDCTGKDNCTGIFLSALINRTDMKTLFINGFPELNGVGYWLPEGKTLIIGSNNAATYAGYKSRGNVISFGDVLVLCEEADGLSLNYGDPSDFACRATGVAINLGKDTVANMGDYVSGGFQYNGGTVHYLANNAAAGLQINGGTALHLGHTASGGMQVNLNSLEYMATDVRGGKQANMGTVNHFGYKSEGGRRLNLGMVLRSMDDGTEGITDGIRTVRNREFPGETYRRRAVKRIREHLPDGIRRLADRLESKIGEVKFKKKEYYSVRKRLAGFDFTRFTAEILKLAGEMEKETEGLYE